MSKDLTATIGKDKHNVTIGIIRKAFIECFKNDKNSTLLGLLEDGTYSDAFTIATILSKLDAFKSSPFGEKTPCHIRELIIRIIERAKLYGGEELVITFEKGILRASITDMDENKKVRFTTYGGYNAISDGICGGWCDNMTPAKVRIKLRTAVCDYLSKYPENKDTVEQLKFFVNDSDRLFYDIISNLQQKTNKTYKKLSPTVNHNLEDNFIQNVYTFDDESIEILPEGFCVKKPNGTNKLIATVVA